MTIMSTDGDEKPPKYNLWLTPYDATLPHKDYLDHSGTNDLMDLWQVLKRTSVDAAQFEGGNGNIFSFRDECPYFAIIWVSEEDDKGKAKSSDVGTGEEDDRQRRGWKDSAAISEQALGGPYGGSWEGWSNGSGILQTRPLSINKRTSDYSHGWPDSSRLEPEYRASSPTGTGNHLPRVSSSAQSSADALHEPGASTSGTSGARGDDANPFASWMDNMRARDAEFRSLSSQYPDPSFASTGDDDRMQVVEEQGLVGGQRALRVMNPDHDEDMDGDTTRADESQNSWATAPVSIPTYHDFWGTAPVTTPAHMRGNASCNNSGARPALTATSAFDLYDNSDVYAPSRGPQNLDTAPKRILIGFIYLSASPVDMISSAFNLGIALKREWRGKGLGPRAVELVLQKVFNDLQIHRLQIGILDSEMGMVGTDTCRDNEALSKWPALKLFTKLGFTHEGTRRRDTKDPITDAWTDSIRMSMLDTDWICRESHNRLHGNEPRSLWTEMLQRHERERTELLRHDNLSGKLKRTGSLETLKPGAAKQTNPIYCGTRGPMEDIPTAETPSSSEATDYESASESVAEGDLSDTRLAILGRYKAMRDAVVPHGLGESSNSGTDDESDVEVNSQTRLITTNSGQGSSGRGGVTDVRSSAHTEMLLERFKALLGTSGPHLPSDTNSLNTAGPNDGSDLNARSDTRLIRSAALSGTSSTFVPFQTQSRGAGRRAQFNFADDESSASEDDYGSKSDLHSRSSPDNTGSIKRRKLSGGEELTPTIGIPFSSAASSSSPAGPSGRVSASSSPAPGSPPRSVVDSGAESETESNITESDVSSRASWDHLEYASDVETVASGIESDSSLSLHSASEDEDAF